MSTDDSHSSPDIDSGQIEAATAQLADLAEIERLYREHAQSLLAFLVSRTRNRSHAEDLSQDFWLKLHTRLNQFDGDNFRAWSFQVLRRQIIDAVRKKKPVAMPEHVEPSTTTIDDDHEEQSLALHTCVQEMTDPPKRLVVAWLAGEDYQKLAASQGIPEGTVASRLNRAKKELTECVKRRMS